MASLLTPDYPARSSRIFILLVYFRIHSVSLDMACSLCKGLQSLVGGTPQR